VEQDLADLGTVLFLAREGPLDLLLGHRPPFDQELAERRTLRCYETRTIR
jgi:hypothetical protein